MDWKNLKRGTVVEVKWVDSMSTSRWHTDAEIDSFAKDMNPCYSIGYFYGLVEDEAIQWLVLYSDLHSDERGNLMKIPVLALLNSRVVREEVDDETHNNR